MGATCKWVTCGACFIFVVIPAIVLIAVSFSKLQATELGLDYDNNFKEIDTKTYTSGLYSLGVGHSFIIFPRTLQTIDFTRESTPLDCVSSDGLPVVLEISFQYQLNQDKLYDLYMSFGDKWFDVFEAVAQHELSVTAVGFSANEFFTNQTNVGDRMRADLQKAFSDQLFSTVDQFQLKSVSLPDEFERAIEETIVASQSIQRAQFVFETAAVDARTVTIQTQYNANITILNAQARAEQTVSLGIAQADADFNLIAIEAQSLALAKSTLNLNNTELESYVFIEALKANEDAQLFVGLQPSIQYPVNP